MTIQTVEVPRWVIECAECGKVADGAAQGWKAYLSGGLEDLPLEVAAFCPACAAGEFEDGRDLI